MNWKQVLINLLVIGVVYSLGYVSSYFFSKRYAIKKGQRDKKRDDKE